MHFNYNCFAQILTKEMPVISLGATRWSGELLSSSVHLNGETVKVTEICTFKNHWNIVKQLLRNMLTFFNVLGFITVRLETGAVTNLFRRQFDKTQHLFSPNVTIFLQRVWSLLTASFFSFLQIINSFVTVWSL